MKDLHSIAILRDRAAMFARVRSFFAHRGILEVDCPILTTGASIDAHIDLIPAAYSTQEIRYLHSSPEYGMKRLLAEGIGDIYQLSHVFRDGECGHKHNPEFMMAEWYRCGFTFPQMIQETFEFIQLFFENVSTEMLSYREAFQRFVDIDYVTATEQDLVKMIERRGIPHYPGIFQEGKDALLNLILASVIEPQLGETELCALTYYPSTQAALAQTVQRENEIAAERFEVYFKGVELANGYHELTDSVEQRYRFCEANIHREKLGKQPLPIDEYFLKALSRGLPDCCGVAVGFDRLMMLRHNTPHIETVIPFAWNKA